MPPFKAALARSSGPGDREAYHKIIEALRQRRGGATAADITAATALSLARTRELLPRAADEFSGRLEVTESGEVRYSFPRGFVSRYRGAGAFARRLAAGALEGLARFGALAFKVWIMVTLIGYFALFMAIALASLCISVAGSSKNSSGRRGGGVFVGPGIFNFIWRLWFYSELTRSIERGYGRRGGGFNREGSPSRPMHRAIFSFVFGEDNPGRDWAVREQKAIVAYIQAHKGVISLPEFMALTGKSGAGAEEAIVACCVEFGGSPEVTGEGTLVYRFDELLLRADTGDRSFSDLSAPLRRLRQFSANPKTMNAWFGIINTVNLLFGSYFLYNAFSTGAIITQEHFNAASYLYGVTYVLASALVQNPLPLIGIGLGLAPAVFSLLFWLIPALRFVREKKENEGIKLDNLRRLGFGRIWERPLAVEAADIDSQAVECRPRDMAAARDRVIKEMGACSIPEVEISAGGAPVYSFTELEREKRALEQYRAGIADEDSSLGKTVFDTELNLAANRFRKISEYMIILR
jgi:hypothetical protein